MLIFFLLFRSCATSGELKQDAQAVTAFGSSLSSVGWQSNLEKSMTVPEFEMLCPAGSLTIHSTANGGIDKPLDRLPIFFSSKVGGPLRVVMRNMSIDMGTAGSISYGTIGYAIDQKTYYILLRPDMESSSSFSQGKKFYDSINGTNVKFVNYLDLAPELAKIPKNAHGIVIVAFDGRNVDTLNELVMPLTPKTTVVSLQGSAITFYKRNATALTLDGSTSYIDDRFAIGAIVSGDKSMYLCAKSVILERAKKITTVYGSRAEQIAISTSPALSINCKELYARRPGGINSTLYLLNRQATTGDSDAYLSELIHPTTLRYLQEDAYSSSCPVIA